LTPHGFIRPTSWWGVLACVPTPPPPPAKGPCPSNTYSAIQLSVHTSAWFYRKPEGVAAAVVRAFNRTAPAPPKKGTCYLFRSTGYVVQRAERARPGRNSPQSPQPL
jgi:hypothetical protein